MLSIATFGLYRDCCNRSAPVSVGGSDGPCPVPPEVTGLVPELSTEELLPTITDSDDSLVLLPELETDDHVPVICEIDGSDLIPTITGVDSDEDC